MKKSFLLHIRLSLAVLGFTVFAIVLPTEGKAQRDTICTVNWWAICCKCKSKCLVVKPYPAFGYCRHCNLLCPDCNRELGNLNDALEKLKGRNQGLKEAYDAHQKDYANAQEKFDDALQRTFGDESKGWTTSGLYGSFGKFTGAVAGVAIDFSGAGLAYKAVPNIISILQSSGSTDAAANSGGALFDILTSNWLMQGVGKEMITNASNKMVGEIKSGMPVNQAIKNFNREINFVDKYTKGVNVGDVGCTLMDLWGLYTATDNLFKDLSDMGDHYTDAIINQNELDKIRDEIVKNADLIACIRETLDSLNSGGLGRNGTTGPYSQQMVIRMVTPAIFKTIWKLSFHFDNKILITGIQSDSIVQVNEYKLKSAILQVGKLKALLITMIGNIEKQLLPPLTPWIANRWKELKPGIQLQMLKLANPPLKVLKGNEERMKTLVQSIQTDLSTMITGYEMDYLSESSNTPGNISTEKNAAGKKNEEANKTANDKWVLTPNENIKGEWGRVNMNFPTDADWSIDFYTPENKFVTNRSSFSKHPMFYDIAPGKYILKLNSIPVENVSVEKGKETTLKSGLLNLVTRNSWDLYNESKEKFYTSGNKPVKFALPVGTYQLRFEDKYYRVVIKDRVTVKFKTPISYLFD